MKTKFGGKIDVEDSSRHGITYCPVEDFFYIYTTSISRNLLGYL